MLRDLMLLASPAAHPVLLARRRAEAIVQRVQAIALLFAALTIAWIGVDATVFDRSLWPPLAAARAVAAAALLALAYACNGPDPTRSRAALLLVTLFAIPAEFFVATLLILRDAPREGLAAGVAAAYSFVPFMLAAGIAAFPLAAIESALLAAFALALQAWALQAGRKPLAGLDYVDSLWLLSLVAGVAAFAAMSQLKLLQALMRQAMRDPLTGCVRRESGEEILDAQLLLATRHGTPLAVLFADIDRFKSVNDHFGHHVGDNVLAEVAASLRGAMRESDVLVRWGGEEFLAILPHASLAEASAFLDRLRVHGFGRLPDGRAVTLSIGLAEYPADGTRGALELVELADRRMYAAKQAGRNRFVADDAGGAAEILAMPA